MALVTYENPQEFKDEEKWFWIFSKNSCCVLGVTSMIWMGLFNLFKLVKLPIIGIILGGIICITATATTMIHLRSSNYMKGGSITIATFIFRYLYQKFHKKLYIKNYDDDVAEIIEQEEKYRKLVDQLIVQDGVESKE